MKKLFIFLFMASFFSNGFSQSGPPSANTRVAETKPPASMIRTVAGGIVGVWAGNFGSGTVYNGAYCSFRFNADGTMQVLAGDRSVIANGTYKYDNNQFSGTYITPSGEIFSFSGKKDNSMLSGTYGNGTDTSNRGSWRVKKLADISANLR